MMRAEIDEHPIKYCRKHANRICALSMGEGCLAQQGTGDRCELQMGSGYISLGSNEDALCELCVGSAGDTLDHDAEGNPVWKPEIEVSDSMRFNYYADEIHYEVLSDE